MPLSINNSDNNEHEIETSFEDSSSNSEDSHRIDIEGQELSIAPQDALNTIIKYHLDGEGHSSLKRELFKQSGLLLVSAFGVMFYYPLAKTYAESICADPTYKDIPCDFLVTSHLTGTMSVAAGILLTATNAFFDQQKREYIPFKLIHILKHPLSPRQKMAGDIGTLLGSFIASIPFMIITVANPIPGLPKLLNISQALIVGITNTLLHLLPFKLALKNPLYRAPFLPIEFIFHATSNLLLSSEEKQEKKLQDQINQDYQVIKQRLINHLDLAQKLLSIYGFSFSGCSYSNEVKNDIRNIKGLNQSPLQLLTRFFSHLHNISPDRHISPPSRINNIVRKVVYFPGASWVILACAGFWGGTFNETTELTGGTVSGAVISAPSIYCLGVLLAFFGGNALQNSYDYLTAWKDDAVKIPIAFKLYPKTSVLLIVIAMYLSTFSYAAGAQLINDNFNDKLAFLRPYLLELAKTGLIFLGFSAMIDFFNHVLSKFAQFGGDEDTQTVARLFEALSQMKDSIQLMQPNLLIDSLAQANENQLKSSLNIKDENDRQRIYEVLIQLSKKLNTKLLKETELTNRENIVKEDKAVCELIEKLGRVSLVSERDTFPRSSMNNGEAEPSERTPLISNTKPSRSVYTSVFRSYLPLYSGRTSGFSPMPTNSLR